MHNEQDNLKNGVHTRASLLLRLQDLEDHEAWTVFVERYTPVIFAWCRRFHLQESDASDITQDVLVKLMRSMQTFQYSPAQGRFRGWLKTVTANAIRDSKRSWAERTKGRGGDDSFQQFLSALQAPDAIESLAKDIEIQHQRELLEQATDLIRARVKANTWNAWEQTSVQGKSAAEAARDLDVAIGEIYVSRSRVSKMLAAEVKRLQLSSEHPQ
jgi:RNA polymerase sigma-70 factor (ECF subfamily)